MLVITNCAVHYKQLIPTLLLFSIVAVNRFLFLRTLFCKFASKHQDFFFSLSFSSAPFFLMHTHIHIYEVPIAKIYSSYYEITIPLQPSSSKFPNDITLYSPIINIDNYFQWPTGFFFVYRGCVSLFFIEHFILLLFFSLFMCDK